MTHYVERLRTCEARKVTADTASDVAEWCGGMAMPDGSVLFKVGDVWLTAPVDTYLQRQDTRLTVHPAAEFEAQWDVDPDA